MYQLPLPHGSAGFRTQRGDIPQHRRSWLPVVAMVECATLYEVFTEDWDEGLWAEDVKRMRDLIDEATDALIFWEVVNGKLMRTCIAGRFA